MDDVQLFQPTSVCVMISSPILRYAFSDTVDNLIAIVQVK